MGAGLFLKVARPFVAFRQLAAYTSFTCCLYRLLSVVSRGKSFVGSSAVAALLLSSLHPVACIKSPGQKQAFLLMDSLQQASLLLNLRTYSKVLKLMMELTPEHMMLFLLNMHSERGDVLDSEEKPDDTKRILDIVAREQARVQWWQNKEYKFGIAVSSLMELWTIPQKNAFTVPVPTIREVL